MLRVLLIEDDRDLCQLIKEFLMQEGMDVELCHDGRSGLNLALSTKYDVVVLDVMLPGFNGLHVLRKLRMTSPIGVLMLTARDQDVDRIIGLEHGADDYLTKPCNPRELVARIRAVVRRLKPSSDQNLFGDLQYFEIGDVVLDKEARRCTLGGELLRLTNTEFDLLEILLRSQGRIVSRKDLVQKVLDRELSPFDRSIDVHISNLRRKLGTYPDGADRIRGIRNVGYIYARPPRSNGVRH